MGMEGARRRGEFQQKRRSKSEEKELGFSHNRCLNIEEAILGGSYMYILSVWLVIAPHGMEFWGK